MEKIVVVGIKFNSLTEEEQNELYSKDRNKYKKDARNSVYDTIRQMVARDETESNEFLNQMLQDEINGYSDYLVIREIFNNAIFEIQEDTIKVLASSIFYGDRRKAAELSKDSKFLNEMLINEINGYKDNMVIEAIINNKAFILEKDTLKYLIKMSK